MENKSSNKNLRKANKEKKDEFYTQLADIERELKCYKDQFRGKVVFCNCDDPKESNFVKYFSMNFEYLGLNKLIATHYKEANLFTKESPYKLEYIGDKNGNRMPDPSEFMVEMISNGDFRSGECIELLKEADIVVTNPPFSLFREYLAQLVEYNKKFLILGNQNALTYKEIFKLIKENKLWLGYDNGGTKWFQVPEEYDIETESRIKIENSIKYFSMGSVVWFTNLDTTKRHEKLTLYKKYSPEEYPKYDNYNAIEVPKVSEIPMDYDGAMGVPVTFIDKYNPEQFEILGNLGSYAPDGYSLSSAIYVNSKKIFKRILIKIKN
ncbi:MAG: adenine-specific methyltransferase EcoRI family protein [bacterium]|nr:adenine-specific methyltransferase EcoRI family protein [bacterium]